MPLRRLPAWSSETETLTKASSPQLVTTPLMLIVGVSRGQLPVVTLSQFFVTSMQGCLTCTETSWFPPPESGSHSFTTHVALPPEQPATSRSCTTPTISACALA